jgi:hypothetical protein
MGRGLHENLDSHPELQDLGKLVSEMSNMKTMMREMARSARVKQQEDICARNRRARDQVKHEHVMRNVAKQMDDQRDYLEGAAKRRHEKQQQKWRKEQLAEARRRREVRMRASPRRRRRAAPYFEPTPDAPTSAFMTEPPVDEPARASTTPTSASARASTAPAASTRAKPAKATPPETFSGGFVVPPRTCANCGRNFPSVMHFLMHDAAGCKKRRQRPATPPTPPTPPSPPTSEPAPEPAPPPYNGRKPWGFAKPREKQVPSRSKSPPPPAEKKAASHSKHPWSQPPKRPNAPAWNRREPPKRAASPPPRRRPTGFTFEGPRRDPPRRPPPPRPETSPRPEPSPTLYDVLGAARYASAGELRKRYRALALVNHPDRNDDDTTAAMMKINSAWDVLGDAAARKRYDASL